jgi:hypothetical protein
VFEEFVLPQPGYGLVAAVESAYGALVILPDTSLAAMPAILEDTDVWYTQTVNDTELGFKLTVLGTLA